MIQSAYAEMLKAELDNESGSHYMLVHAMNLCNIRGMNKENAVKLGEKLYQL